VSIEVIDYTINLSYISDDVKRDFSKFWFFFTGGQFDWCPSKFRMYNLIARHHNHHTTRGESV
jgi:hypothetical protein